MTATNPKLAVFIDCENASAKLLANVFMQKATIANASIKRAYGKAASLQSWQKFLAEHSFQPQLTPPSAIMKDNAADFTMVIDCMHLLHAHPFDEAWLVTCDADFVQLAMHIRTHGVHVTCVGEQKKMPDSLRNACNNFVPYAAKTSAVSAPSKPAPPVAVVKQVVEIFKSLDKPEGVGLSVLGKTLNDRLGKDYKKGYGGLAGFLEKTGLFSIKEKIARLK
ncbi:MAG: NYN domain-containing protein [Hyphomicrobiales bacterium]